MKSAPDVRHAPTRVARKNFGLFLVSRFRIENYWGVRRFDYFEKLRSMDLDDFHFKHVQILISDSHFKLTQLHGP